MILPILAIVIGLVLLVWSADLFVEGSAATAKLFGMPPLLIGMIVIGFGTSAPELIVSLGASLTGNPGVALGNAYGSNIANIGIILGLTALIKPISVHSQVIKRELPILLSVTLFSVWLLMDGEISKLDGLFHLLLFTGVMGWTILKGLRNRDDALVGEVEHELADHPLSPRKATLHLIVGLLILLASARVLVWGAVEVATSLGVSNLIIGLTVVAIGTSLPELASSISAARKGEPDLALGNVIGSNLFNTLAVVGIAGAIHPLNVGPEIFYRDAAMMVALTVSIFVFAKGFWAPGHINRFEGSLLLLSYFGYGIAIYLTAFA